ncbi:MAG TPA: DUF3857 domain-containing protein [Candidatus Angelobacter sp.]
MTRTTLRCAPFLAGIFLLVSPSSCLAQEQGWLPITQQDKQIKQVPGRPGADAIQLYFYQSIDDAEENNEAEYIYRRIKVLNEKGARYANVEIIVPNGFRLLDLKARTIHPDGKINEFTGKPLDKMIVRGRGFRVTGKRFTLPAVTPESIIEYRYKLDYPANEYPQHEWTVQQDLYTLKAYFRMRAYSGPMQGVTGATGISCSYNLPRGVEPEKKGEGFELRMEDIPAFEAEDYMPPEQPYRYHVSFFYGGKELTSVEAFWRDTGLRWSEVAESFIGNRKEISDAAAQAIAGEADLEGKLRKLYARAQRLRNLSYERARRPQESKRENLKTNQNVGDVLAHGYGDREEITYLFIALARAAGFAAWPVRTSNRGTTLFEKSIVDAHQLDGLVALVRVNGANVFLDPGTRFCPFGALRWFTTSTEGLRLDKDNPEFVMLPGAGFDKAMIERAGVVTLNPDGSLIGEVSVTYSGTQALERRLEALETDNAGRKRSLEDEVMGWLPPGAGARLKDSMGWEDTEGALRARFAIAVPGYASVLGANFLVPAYLFRTAQKDAFSHEHRMYPVYFPYASSEIDSMRVTLPAGYTLQRPPSDVQAGLPYASYRHSVELRGEELTAIRVLQLNVVSCPLEEYGKLKAFFGQVEAGDEERVVFHGGEASAQKNH